MEQTSPLFILAGNGSYYNRGCEAITRGTVSILRNFFDDPRFLAVSSYKSEEQFRQQRLKETDMSIVHKKMYKSYRPFDFLWFVINGLRVVHPRALKHIIYKDLKPYLDEAEAVLALGGDNYSLDYAKGPIVLTKGLIACTELDDLVVASGKPLIIWGASVGPFSKHPAYEKYMINHLRKVHILARETATVEYLADKGLTENVHRVADPAFVMKPTEPQKVRGKLEIEEGSVGLNLSTLMARFVTNGNLKRWSGISASIIHELLRRTDCRIYLIPHVSGPFGQDDHKFLRGALSMVPDQSDRVILVPPTFNASETKWIISKMSVFAGSRMHSVIASLSSCVPTLTFGYSIKAKGINRDVFGHTDFCLSPDMLSPEVVAGNIQELLQESNSLRRYLEPRIVEIQDLAMKAGAILKKILKET